LGYAKKLEPIICSLQHACTKKKEEPPVGRFFVKKLSKKLLGGIHA
jgi:hypothetical protein